MTPYARERLNIAVRLVVAGADIPIAFDVAQRVMHEHVRRVGGNEPAWGALGQLVEPDEGNDGDGASS